MKIFRFLPLNLEYFFTRSAQVNSFLTFFLFVRLISECRCHFNIYHWQWDDCEKFHCLDCDLSQTIYEQFTAIFDLKLSLNSMFNASFKYYY